MKDSRWGPGSFCANALVWLIKQEQTEETEFCGGNHEIRKPHGIVIQSSIVNGMRLCGFRNRKASIPNRNPARDSSELIAVTIGAGVSV
jgi:hypothetical protein